MSKRAIVAYWLLLLVPTLFIGSATFRLLAREKERTVHQLRSSTLDRIAAIGESIQLGVIAVEEGMTEALSSIRGPDTEKTLREWERSNPLVRNVFIWSAGDGLLLPRAGHPETSEERRFMARYEALFSGRVPWQTPKGDSDATTEPQPPPPSAETPWQLFGRNMEAGRMQKAAPPEEVPPGKPAQDEFRVRASESAPAPLSYRSAAPVKLRRLAKLDSSLSEPAAGSGPAPARPESGWVTWFWENRLHLLGWVQRSPDSPVYGVEIEMSALLSRVVADLPRDVLEGMVYALVDGNGQVLHQVGAAPLAEKARPDLSVSLAPHLPHWQVAAYFVDGALAARSGQAFIILTGLLLAIFLAAIMLGGSMLLWQAHRNLVDARQKTSFVSNVSHELKTPLTSIRMYAELLSSGRVKDPHKTGGYLNVIVSESERLTRLVNNVLDFSRLEQGRKKYWLEELDVCEFVRDLVETQRLRARKADMKFDLSIAGEPVIIETDRDSLEQVLVNLIDNAIKYAGAAEPGAAESAEPGPGVPVSSGADPAAPERTAPGEISIVLRTIEDHVELLVMDRGPGVPAGHQDRIFEKFHRVDDSLTTRRPGSGLGLSIARRLLRDLGGDLTYQPRPGGGSCFVAKLGYGGRHESRAHSDR